ncbi:MAG: endonuclease III domain-containing protein, partial [Campylobacter hyointestinalis]
MRTKQDIQKIKNLFLENFSGAKSELKFKNLYELIVCVMLSAQCTDKRVNLITPALFEAYPDIKALAGANLSSLKMFINSCSFFNNKA